MVLRRDKPITEPSPMMKEVEQEREKELIGEYEDEYVELDVQPEQSRAEQDETETEASEQAESDEVEDAVAESNASDTLEEEKV